MPLAEADSVKTTFIGAALENVSLRIRDPVTITSSIWSSSGTWSCASVAPIGYSAVITAAVSGVMTGVVLTGECLLRLVMIVPRECPGSRYRSRLTPAFLDKTKRYAIELLFVED
jgi:hypothetical protein